ncbi:MAG: cation:proton antiporter [Defluviitaleaceae bacterium]|nr:cation:proton antiporter [Defluviitaleaceae bacterium]
MRKKMQTKMVILALGAILLAGCHAIEGLQGFHVTETGLSLIAVLIAGLLAPLLSSALKRWIRIPVPVSEMTLGILIGPGVLALVQPSAVIEYLRVIGVILLFFVGGYDTDFGMLGKKAIGKATWTWILCLLVSIPVGIGVAFLFSGLEGLVPAGVGLAVAGIAIGASTIATGLTTVYPMMQDAGEMTTKIGKGITAAGVIGQFAPVVAVAVVSGAMAEGGSVAATLVNHTLFFAAVGVAIFFARKGLPRFLAKQQTATLEMVGQMGIRDQAVILFLIVGFGLALGVDRLLGAFAAGIVIRQLFAHVETTERKIIESKVKAIAFGVFVPIFFVMAGVNFDLLGMIAQPLSFFLIPVFMLMKFLVRGLPGSLILPQKSTRLEHASTGFMISCSIAGVLAVLGIAQHAGVMSSVMAAGLTGSAMLTVLVFPTIGLILARKARVKTLNASSSAF